MRTIKFRGKNTFNNRWEYGSLVKEKDGALWIIPEDQMLISEGGSFSAAHVSSETVGQFTGLKDKNGVEIYEGDVFTVNGVYPKVVKYIEEWLSFSVANIDIITTPPMSGWPDKYIYQQLYPGWWKDFQNEIEVIGNIYDNPELLK